MRWALGERVPSKLGDDSFKSRKVAVLCSSPLSNSIMWIPREFIYDLCQTHHVLQTTYWFDHQRVYQSACYPTQIPHSWTHEPHPWVHDESDMDQMDQTGTQFDEKTLHLVSVPSLLWQPGRLFNKGVLFNRKEQHTWKPSINIFMFVDTLSMSLP